MNFSISLLFYKLTWLVLRSESRTLSVRQSKPQRRSGLWRSSLRSNSNRTHTACRRNCECHDWAVLKMMFVPIPSWLCRPTVARMCKIGSYFSMTLLYYNPKFISWLLSQFVMNVIAIRFEMNKKLQVLRNNLDKLTSCDPKSKEASKF